MNTAGKQQPYFLAILAFLSKELSLVMLFSVCTGHVCSVMFVPKHFLGTRLKGSYLYTRWRDQQVRRLSWMCAHIAVIMRKSLYVGSYEEFVLVEDYIPKEEDRKQHLMAKAGEVVKVLQKTESGMLYLISHCFYMLIHALRVDGGAHVKRIA